MTMSMRMKLKITSAVKETVAKVAVPIWAAIKATVFKAAFVS